LDPWQILHGAVEKTGPGGKRLSSFMLLEYKEGKKVR
jgi:hypothetical protein